MTHSLRDLLQTGQAGRPFVAMAPLAGYTDSAFRQLCRDHHAQVLWTEMVSATGLKYKQSKMEQLLAVVPGDEERAATVFCDSTYAEILPQFHGRIPAEINLLRYTSVEQPLVVQIFGKVPEDAYAAACLLGRLGYAGIDINMGCPARKVINSFHGCSLMRDEGLAREMVQAVKAGLAEIGATDMTVSVKMRAGWDSVTAPRFAAVMETAGADFLTVHARTKQQGFRGRADWDIIRQTVEAVSIPVIGNGDVVDGESAWRMIDQTRCAGVMVGRAAMGKPWIFTQIVKAVSGRSTTAGDITAKDRLSIARQHCEYLVRMKGEERGMREARKHLVAYIKGIPQAGAWRARCVRVETLAEVFSLLQLIGDSLAQE
ncbi:MAG TPA: tRNA-dihydrouridine synthase family protein [bacterium]|nr:tRNA-dihydrouridine synthase family protein [bacterium]